jgi:hypothetical protein
MSVDLASKETPLGLATRGVAAALAPRNGRIRALGTGAIEPRNEDITSLMGLARATAALVAHAGFDPAGDPRDGMRRRALLQEGLRGS